MAKAHKNGFIDVSELLAPTVVDDKGEPIYTVEQWEQYGADHYKSALDLFSVAMEVCGLDAEANKKKS